MNQMRNFPTLNPLMMWGGVFLMLIGYWIVAMLAL